MNEAEAIAEVNKWKKNPNNVCSNRFFAVIAALDLEYKSGSKHPKYIQISAGDWRNGLTLCIEQKKKIEPKQIQKFVKWYENTR